MDAKLIFVLHPLYNFEFLKKFAEKGYELFHLSFSINRKSQAIKK
jgi:hypothetical protein